MLDAFWVAIGSKLADRWAAAGAPALIFWLGGLAAWCRHRGGLHTLRQQTDWLDAQSTGVQAAVILAASLAVLSSGLVVARLATPTLRLLEGYWPAWTAPARSRLAAWLAARAATEQPAWQEAYAQVSAPNTPTGEQLAAYTRLERRRRRRPAAAGYFLPTPIGNILRAAERRPLDKYGLDVVILWPRLWPALPETTRADLLAARGSLDAAVTTAIWGVLFCAFTPLAWPALPIGLAVAAASVVAVVPARAQTFGDLLEAAFDQHRYLLYSQLRWPLPGNPAEERAAGRRLTWYLWRGSSDPDPVFTPPTGAG